MDRMQDIVKRERVKELYKVADLHIMYTDEIKKTVTGNYVSVKDQNL